jgi:hypothetical protein
LTCAPFSAADDLQLEEREAGVDVEELLFALLIDIFLERRRRFWVVSIEAVENFFNVRWALFASVERLSHLGCWFRLLRSCYWVSADFSFSGARINCKYVHVSTNF